MQQDREQEAREFAREFRRFLEWLHGPDGGGERNEVVALVQEHVGAAGREQPVVGRQLPPLEHVNLQVALDAWRVEAGRDVRVHKLSMPPHFGGLSLHQLLHGQLAAPERLSAPDLVDLPSGPDRTLACLSSALLLVHDARGRYVVRVAGPQPHGEPVLTLEVAGLATADAQAVLRELAELRSRLTTNRADLLEPALAARPGRVDVTVEIGRPDPAARQRLFQLYAGGVPLELSENGLAEVVARTEGAPPAS